MDLDAALWLKQRPNLFSVCSWFINWCKERVSPALADSLSEQPVLLVLLVKEFGKHLFSSGKPLYVLRRLVVMVQKQVFGARSFISPGWELIQKWEDLEPPSHRIPIPPALVRAMAVTALQWNWGRFACAVLISFFGIARPGEVLRAFRSDLVLPSDLMSDEDSPAFLQARSPKPRRKGPDPARHCPRTLGHRSFGVLLQRLQ